MSALTGKMFLACLKQIIIYKRQFYTSESPEMPDTEWNTGKWNEAVSGEVQTGR